MSDQTDASGYMRRRAAADPMLANRWAHRFVPPPTTYASADDELASAAASAPESAMLREDYDDPFNTHQPMAIAHEHSTGAERRHQADPTDDEDEDPFASQDDPPTADEQHAAAAAAESSADRASKRARVSLESNGIAAGAGGASIGTSFPSPHQPQLQPLPPPSSSSFAAPAARSTKRFSKTHQLKEGRTIVATAQVSSEIPRDTETEGLQDAATSAAATAAAAASCSSAAAAALASPAVPVTPGDPRRRKRSQSSSAGVTAPTTPTAPSSSSASESTPAASAPSTGTTTSPRLSLDALKGFFSRHPEGIAAAAASASAAAAAAAAAAPVKPSINGAASAESGGWASAHPTLADFPSASAASASPVSQCGAPWIADYSCSSTATRYPPAVIEDRIGFLANQVARSGEEDTRIPNPGALKQRYPNLTLTPTFLVMGCAVIMRQSRLSREQGSRLLPILETVEREHMVPPALLADFRALLGQFQSKLEQKHLPALAALQARLEHEASPPRAVTPPGPRTPPRSAPSSAPPSALPSAAPLGGLLGHLPAAGHAPFAVTPAHPHALVAVMQRPAFIFNSDSPPPPPLPLPPTQMQHPQQLSSAAAATSAVSSAPPAPFQFTSQHHQAPGQRWVTSDYSHQQPPHAHAPQPQLQQSVVGATTPLAGHKQPASRRWDVHHPLRAPLSASFVPASGAAASAAPKMQPSYASTPAVKQLVPSISPFTFHLPTSTAAAATAAAAGSASGSSASTAICLDDSEPVVTVASVVASQTLSLSDSQAFVHASFASDDLIHRQKLPLVDPLTLARISIPVRSRFCHHVRCLDLATILMQAAETASRGKPLRCPICNEPIALQDLVVDSFIKLRLEEASRLPDASELILHRDGSYAFTGDNGKELKQMARTNSAPSLSGAAAGGAAPTQTAAAAASSSTTNSRSKRDTVDLLDSDAEQSESEVPPPPAPRPQPPLPVSRARSATGLPLAASAPRSQYADKRPRSSSPAAAASDADESRSEDEDGSRSATPIHRGRGFSDPPSSDADASSSAASSPALAPRRPPPAAAGAAGAPVPFPSSYAIPRSAWNGPSVLLGQGAAAAPRGSPSQLRPAAAASSAPAPRVFRGSVDVDLTVSSDESDEASSVQAIEHPHAQHQQQQLRQPGQAHDEVEDANGAAIDAAPAAAASSASSSPVKPLLLGVADAAPASASEVGVDLDAFSPEINLASSKPVQQPQPQHSAAQILQIDESLDDAQMPASVPVHPPSLHTLPPLSSAASPSPPQWQK